MAYTPTVWQTGDTITAEKLNKLENGVASGEGGSFLVTATPTGQDTATIDKTYNEILTALASGQIPIMNVVVDGEYKASMSFNRVATNKVAFSTTEYMPDDNNIIVKITNAFVASNNAVYFEELAYTASAVNE